MSVPCEKCGAPAVAQHTQCVPSLCAGCEQAEAHPHDTGSGEYSAGKCDGTHDATTCWSCALIRMDKAEARVEEVENLYRRLAENFDAQKAKREEAETESTRLRKALKHLAKMPCSCQELRCVRLDKCLGSCPGAVARIALKGE